MRKGQRRKFTLYAALAGLGLGAAAWASGETGLVIFDAPRGAWLAEVRPGASMTVIEERDGWRHVRVEGWIPVPAGAPAATSPAASPAAPSNPAATPVAAAASTPDTGAPGGGSVRGVLLPRPGMVPATVGANLVVLLVDDLAQLDADQEAIGARCRATLKDFDQQLADLEVKVKGALNSTTNFTEASRRYDRAKAERAAARNARAAAIKSCYDESDALYDRHAVARVGSDGGGQYEFRGVADGDYRVVARDRQAETTRAWALVCPVQGGRAVTLDGLTAPAAPDPYWGLR